MLLETLTPAHLPSNVVVQGSTGMGAQVVEQRRGVTGRFGLQISVVKEKAFSLPPVPFAARSQGIGRGVHVLSMGSSSIFKIGNTR